MEIRKLSAAGLVKSYRGKNVINGISIDVNPGEVVGLLGPNGAGKTTTFNMFVGLVHQDYGSILINGEDISRSPMYIRARKGLNYLPQESSIFKGLTVKENIIAILQYLKISNDESQEKLNNLLHEFNISHLQDNRAYTLSGGERRRVEIARALVTSPEYILLDEPFAGLDPITVLEVKKIITKLKFKGIGVMISDHNAREILSVCDRIYIINEGIVLTEGVPAMIVSCETARKIYFGENFRL
jgi:lipopolysaccharide export system ATP-binding protein